MDARVVRRCPALWLALCLTAAAHLARTRDRTPPPEPRPGPLRFTGVVLPGVAIRPDHVSFNARPRSRLPFECARIRVSIASGVFHLDRYFDPPLRPGQLVSFRAPARLPAYHQMPGVADRRRLETGRGCAREFRLKSPLQLRRPRPPPAAAFVAPAYRYAEGFVAMLERRLPEPERALALALFLGRRELLQPDRRRRARELGIWHLYVVSGFHVGVLAGLVLLAARRRPFHRMAAAGVVWTYAVLTGLSLSVVRASFALTLLLAAGALRLRTPTANGLGTVVVAIWLWDRTALTSAGFHFTMACLAGLAAGAPAARAWKSLLAGAVSERSRLPTFVGRQAADRRRRRLRFQLDHLLHPAPARWACRALPAITRGAVWLGVTAILSAAALAAVLPLSLYYGNLFTPAAVANNLVAMPLCSLLIVLLALLFGLYWTPLGPPLAKLTAIAATGFEAAVAGLAGLQRPGYEPQPHWAQMLLYWSLLLLIAASVRRRPGLLAALVLAPALLLPVGQRPEGRLQVTMLDVGQGEAIHLRYPDGSDALVDAGGQPGARDPTFIGERLVARYLWTEGVRRLDAAYVTHADADHSQGFRFIRRAFSIQAFFAAAWPTTSSRAAAGATWRQAGVLHRVLWPADPSAPREGNDESLVLLLEYGALRVLLTGDITRHVETRLLPVLGAVTVLKVAHHGSSSSTGSRFVDATRPRVALISAGRRNLFGHPSPEVVARLRAAGAAVFVTATDGTLRLSSDGTDVQLERYDGWRSRFVPAARFRAGSSPGR